MTLEMMDDRILVTPIEEREVGIIEPLWNKGVVEDTGPGPYVAGGHGRRSLTVSPGCTVLYEGRAGVWIQIDDMPRLVLREADIIAIVRE